MADTKISGLPAATTSISTDQYAINQGGVSKSVTAAIVSGAVAPDPYDVSGTTVADAQFLLQYQHLRVSSTGRFTAAGTGEIYVSDFGAYDTSPIVGQPKVGSFTLPENYVYYLFTELRLAYWSRATLQGFNSDLVISDDFKTRQRIVLQG